MSATVGAALKKAAVSLLGNKKVLKFIGGVILGLIILVAMPIAAIVGIFNGEFEIDTDRLQQLVVENMSAEQKAKLQFVENTMYAIEDGILGAGFPAKRVKEAQVLFVLALSEHAHESGFVSRLVSCFAEEQTDEQLIAAVNAEFGTDISAEDFAKVMRAIRATYIDTSRYGDPTTKNNEDLVVWVKEARDAQWGYVWGTHCTVLTEDVLAYLLELYPENVGDYEAIIRSKWLGGRTADCTGLIKGYGWLDPETGEVGYGTNGMPDINSEQMYQNATEKGPISTIPEIPGLAVWFEGHIGVYIGDGKVVEAMGTAYGVRETTLSRGRWTHWLKIPYINYIEEEVEEP